MKTSWFLLDIGEVEQFRQFDALPIGCVVLRNGAIVSANSFFAEEVGLTKMQLIDKEISEFLVAMAPSADDFHFDQLMSCQLGSRKNISLQLKCSNGTTKNVAVNINAIENKKEDKNKKAKKQVNCLLTITNLEGLSKSGSNIDGGSSDKVLDLVMDNSYDSYVIFDVDYRVIFYNKEAASRYKTIHKVGLANGKSLKELVGHAKGFEERVITYRQVMETGEPAVREVSYTIDGKDYYFHNRLSCLKDQDGKTVGILSCARDYSDLVNSQRELADRNLTLKAILESTRDGIAAFDSDFKVLACNKQAIDEYQKFTNVDLLSKQKIQEQLRPEEFSRWQETIFNKVLSGEEIDNIVRREQTNQIFRNIYTPVKNLEGEILGTLEISRDITESEKRREEIRKSEERYRNLIDHMPTGIAKLSKDGMVSYVSPRGADFFGYTQDDLVGRSLLDLMKDSEKDRMVTEMQLLLKEGNEEKYSQHTYIHKEGYEIRLEGIASISKTNSEDFTYLLAFNDVTERYETQLKLSSKESDYASLYKNMHDSVIIYDHKNERYIDCNDAGLELFQRTKTDLHKQKSTDTVPEYSSLIPGVNLHERLLSNRKITAQGEEVENSTTVILGGDGVERLVSVNIVPKSNDEVYLIMKDITEAQETKQLLQEKTSVYEALITNSFDGIDIVKYDISDGYFVNGELLMRNERMAKMIGGSMTGTYDSDEALLAISPEFQPNGKKSIDVAKEVIVSTLQQGSSLIEYRFEHDLGSYDVRASQKMVEIDSYVYLIKNYRDITDAIKQRGIIEEQIQALNDKNEEMKIYIESNLQLENFAYIASHDLKAPIRSVISFAQLLKNNSYEQLGPKNGRFLDIIITASTNMQVLIDDLLAYSRINTQEIEFENVDMNKLLKHLLIEINQSIVEKNGEVVIKNLPETLVGDASRIRQIFQNLITNGMKFHHEGQTPKVEIDFVEKRENFEFSVRDYGIGIEEQYLREIFLMFKKLHSENKYKGTGIGLSICKKIVDQHEGNIWVESKLGEGSTFYFTICKHLKTNI